MEKEKNTTTLRKLLQDDNVNSVYIMTPEGYLISSVSKLKENILSLTSGCASDTEKHNLQEKSYLLDMEISQCNVDEGCLYGIM